MKESQIRWYGETVAAIAAGGLLALAGKIIGGATGNALVILAFPVNLAVLICGRLPDGKGAPKKS